MVAVFVEGNQGCHRDACRLQSDEEHQEVSGRNHEVHTQQGGKCQNVELTLFDGSVWTAHPFVRHQEYNQCTYTEDGFHDALYRLIVIHAAESICTGPGTMVISVCMVSRATGSIVFSTGLPSFLCASGLMKSRRQKG